jgi:hypothetical protein
MQQQPTFNFGLTKNFCFIYHTLSMPKTIELWGQTQNFFIYLFYFPSQIPLWVWFVQKTRAKKSHAWAPLTIVIVPDPLDSRYRLPFLKESKKSSFLS